MLAVSVQDGKDLRRLRIWDENALRPNRMMQLDLTHSKHTFRKRSTLRLTSLHNEHKYFDQNGVDDLQKSPVLLPSSQT